MKSVHTLSHILGIVLRWAASCTGYVTLWLNLSRRSDSQTRTYLHLAIGRCIPTDDRASPTSLNSPNCGCAFSGSGIGPRRIGGRLSRRPPAFKGPTVCHHPNPAFVCSQCPAQEAGRGLEDLPQLWASDKVCQWIWMK